MMIAPAGSALPSEVEGEQEQQAQHEDGGDHHLRRGAEVLMVNVLPRRAADRTPALYHRSGTLRADQVFAAHRNPFRLARVPVTLAVAAM
jgi:hypothetical protein